MLHSSNSAASFWQHARELGGGRNSNFWLFESSIWLHVVATSLISVFIPILLLQKGFDLQTVLLFYVLFHTINAPVNFLAGYLVSKIGARYTIIISVPFQIAFFITYGLITPGHVHVIFLLALCTAIYDALYYTASLFLFMNATQDVNNSGKNTGILYTVARSAGIVGPVLGSTILLWSGSQTALLIAVVITFTFSIIPLFYISLENKQRATMPPLKEFITKKYFWGNHISLSLYKIGESVGQVLWPVFIFLFFGTLESVAALAILAPLIALGFSFFTGRINLQHRYIAIALGAALLALIWLGRIGFENGTWYYVSVILGGLCGLLMQVPIDANLFRAGKESNELMASVMKNAVSMATKACMFLILYIAVVFTEQSYEFGFIIALLAMIGLFGFNTLRQYNK